MRMRKVAIFVVCILLALAAISGFVGHVIGPSVLHPAKAPLDPAKVAWVDVMVDRTHALREDFAVRAGDGVTLRCWKIRPMQPNGDWVLLFHGVADNRTGTAVFAEFLLRAGYGVVMMDSRAQGESGGDRATYGYLERGDTRAIVNALESSENVRRLFALGVSMGAAIALQSAAVEPRILAVSAEDPLASLHEVSFDYSGLQRWPWLGMTLFRPAAIEAMRTMRSAGGFDPAQVSPEESVRSRAFATLLICGTEDHTIPCRHAEMIHKAARGPSELWIVQGATHAAAYGVAPEEYAHRVLALFQRSAS